VIDVFLAPPADLPLEVALSLCVGWTSPTADAPPPDCAKLHAVATVAQQALCTRTPTASAVARFERLTRRLAGLRSAWHHAAVAGYLLAVVGERIDAGHPLAAALTAVNRELSLLAARLDAGLGRSDRMAATRAADWLAAGMEGE
jgi:hypothetical protein